MKNKKCKHDFIELSRGFIGGIANWAGGKGFFSPTILKCKTCKKVYYLDCEKEVLKPLKWVR